MEETRKLIGRRAVLFGFAAALLSAAAYLPMLAVPFAPLIAAAIAILFIAKSKLFYILSALTLCLPLAYLGDTVAVVLTALTTAAATGVILSMRIKKHLFAAGLVMVMCMTAFTVPALIYLTVNQFTAEDPSNGRFVSAYIKENKTRPDIQFLSLWYYAQKQDDGSFVSEKGSSAYKEVANEYFAALSNRWAEEVLFEFLLGYGSMTAIFAFLLTHLLQKRFRIPPPLAVDEPPDGIPASVLPDPFADPLCFAPSQSAVDASNNPDLKAEATPPKETDFIKTAPFAITNLGLGRGYAMYVFLPVSLFAFLGYYEPLAPVTVAFFNALVVVPCFFAAISLCLFCAAKISNKGIRIASVTFILILGVLGVWFAPVMLLLSLFGLADAILNVRKLLNYALS